MVYDKILEALEQYQKDKTINLSRYDKNNLIHQVTYDQMQAYAEELQDDIDEAQRKLDELLDFEGAWNNK